MSFCYGGGEEKFNGVSGVKRSTLAYYFKTYYVTFHRMSLSETPTVMSGQSRF